MKQKESAQETDQLPVHNAHGVAELGVVELFRV